MVKPAAEPTREEQLQSQLSQQLNLPSLQDSSAAVNPKPQPPEGKVVDSRTLAGLSISGYRTDPRTIVLILSDKNVCPNDARDPGMGDRTEAV